MNDLKERIQNLLDRLKKALAMINLDVDRAELKSLEEKSQAEDFWQNQEIAQDIMQKISDTNKKINAWDDITNEIQSLDEMAEITDEKDHEMIRELKGNLQKTEKTFEALEFELFFSDKYDKNNAILSVYAGSGGTDAQDWAEMLLRMYLRYFEKRGFKATILSETAGEEAGIKNASIEVKGMYAYGYLKSEQGVHRLVRISPFDADKARHTSFALVEVIPEVEDQKINIDEKDLKLETFRASGHGGQSVNTTDSAVRITHLPTGISVQCQNERSQLQNKQMAMKVLQSKISDLEEKKNREQAAKLKGENVSAEWGNQIRSYVIHPYTLVKDHRTGFESTNAQSILDGDLDLFVESYLRGTNISKD